MFFLCRGLSIHPLVTDLAHASEVLSSEWNATFSPAKLTPTLPIL